MTAGGALLFSPAAVCAQATLTILHPAEGASLPAINETFIYGAVTAGSTLTANGTPIPVHPQGGYLAIVPVKPGPVLLALEAKTPQGETAKLERRFSVAQGPTQSPAKPLTLERGTLEPSEDVRLAPGDVLRVSFQGSPGATAEYAIEHVAKHIPMRELDVSSASLRGRYEGDYIIQPGDDIEQGDIEITFKGSKKTLRVKTKGRLTIDSGAIPQMGVVTEDIVALRTGAQGGYDLFLYKGMRVRLTGKMGREWRVRLSSIQTGWIRDSAIQVLPRGTAIPRSALGNMKILRLEESSLIRVPLGQVLPYRVEQSLDPTQLVVTLYGAVDRTDLIQYVPQDPVIRLVRWKQVAPDTCQITIDPKFKKWWGFDVRYEGRTLVLEIRRPWRKPDLGGMVIAIDPGHGGTEPGAIGPHGTFEKDANLAIALVLRDTLEEAGAKPFLTREKDVTVPLYDRPRLAWEHNARLFVSIHGNSSAAGQNPLLQNGYSLYWYQPQSLALAEALHAAYGRRLTLPDHGFYYNDLAVCRMTQMPSVLTEQAFIIVPEQEILLFDPAFQRAIARAITGGIRRYVNPVP